MDLPSGTVTFLFSDIEGSTRMLSAHPNEYAEALLRVDALMRSSVSAARGVVFETVGDAVYAAFERPSDAISAAIASQRALGSEDWGTLGALRMRMVIHIGEVEVRGQHYFGAPLYRCARLMAIGHGGQVLVSEAAAATAARALPHGAALRDMGRHRLKDFADPELVLQLVHPELPSEFPPLRSLDAMPNNLPLLTTTFVGRHEEKERISATIAERRLVTLTGPGGSGKTRLALEVASEALADHPDGVWLVELAPLSEPRSVLPSVAETLHVREERERPLDVSIVEALRARRMLLIFDNCEHLLDPVASLASAISRTCADVRVVATSREPLGVAGEVVVPVAPLDAPDAEALFVERARRAGAPPTIDGPSQAAIANICRRLDGIPLAIEIAASRVRAFSLAEIERRLDDRFHFLTSGDRSALPRQRTLKALIDWSYDLLDPAEQALLAELSVFAGSFELDAVERVCGNQGEHETAEILARLVDKSLVDAHLPDYRLLDTIRSFASEKLGPRIQEVRSRHLDWALATPEIGAFGRSASGMVIAGGSRPEWFAMVEGRHDDLRAALRFAIARPGDAVHRLLAILAPFWLHRGSFIEGRQWLAEAMSRDDEPSAALVSTYSTSGDFAMMLDDVEAATTAYGRSVALAERLERTDLVAASLLGLAQIAAVEGDLATTRRLVDRARDAAPEGAPTRGSFQLGLAEMLSDSLADAAEHLRRAEERARSVGDVISVAVSRVYRAVVAQRSGQTDQARALFAEGVRALRGFGFTFAGTICMTRIAIFEAEVGDLATAATLLGAAAALQRATTSPMYAFNRRDAEAARVRAMDGLTRPVFELRASEGERLSFDGAMDLAERALTSRSRDDASSAQTPAQAT